MPLLSNTEVAKMYNVSRPTVTLWVSNAKKGNNSLILSEDQKIQDLATNHAELERLTKGGRKFKSNNNMVKTTPTDYFFDTYSIPEVVEIINSIQTRSEIPHKFVYKGAGGEWWDQFYSNNVAKGNYQNPLKVSKLLEASLQNIVDGLSEHQMVNIIEIGPGNSDPTIRFLEGLIKKQKLNKYIAIDISNDLLNISAANIETRIQGLEFVGITGDIETLDLATILFENSSEYTVNIILYLGSTIGIHQNRAKVLDNIRQGLNPDDLFIFSNTVENSKTKMTSDYAKSSESIEQNTRILKNLGVEVEDCERKFYYDQTTSGKFLAIVMNKDYLIDFSEIGTNKSLYLEKGTEVIVWRLHMTSLVTVAQELSQSNLLQVGLLSDKDRTHCLVLCQAM